MRPLVLLSLFLFVCPLELGAEQKRTALTLYGARMTVNDWQDFFTPEKVQWQDSYLVALSLSRTLGGWRERLSYAVEGQVVKHFKEQDHWEFNLLGVLRWHPFPWDRWLETSAAFGLGPSWATRKPEIEIRNDGETDRLLVYWMLELAVAPLRETPRLEIVSRIHHRSDAYGLVAEDGGSNALGLGLRYRF